MNGAFVHLALNHIPVMGMPFAFLLLLGGRIRRSEELTRAGLVALVAVAIITVPVWKSGGPAAHVLKNSGIVVNWPSVHEHAEAAEAGTVAIEILGAFALLGLIFYRRMGGLPLIPFATLMIVASFLISGWMFRVAHLGGLIRHPEIASDYQPVPVAPAEPSSQDKDND